MSALAGWLVSNTVGNTRLRLVGVLLTLGVLLLSGWFFFWVIVHGYDATIEHDNSRLELRAPRQNV